MAELDTAHQQCWDHWIKIRPELASTWWFKCSKPEKPGDDYTMYLFDCDACVLGLVADSKREPHGIIATRDLVSPDDDTVIGRRTLVECLTEANAWREASGLKPIGAM